jgi:EpsD family peptidyl-prolyl cis-trans isomerase
LKAKTLMLTAAIAASFTLAGCDQVKKLVGGKPKGQVVATVDGQEITSLELRQEMAGFSSRDPKIIKQAQQQALQQIILRRLVVQKAKDEKLDKSTDYTLQVRRGEEGLLTQLYERKLATALTPPTAAEAQAYVASHPGQFAERKIYSVDQLIAAPNNKLDAQKLSSLKTLEDVKALFDTNSVPYQQSVGEMDSLTANPQMVAQISRLPSGEVFVVPQRGAYVFNRVASVRAVPFTGDLANNYAMNALRQQRGGDAVRKNIEALRKSAESKIVYAPGYKPDAPAKPAAAAPARAPAAAPAAPPAK